MKLGLTILLNNMCNLKCAYCYERNSGEYILTKENIDSILDRFSKMSFFNGSVELFGGEPTLSLNVIDHMLQKYPNYSYNIITNGYFLKLNDKDIEVLKKVNDIVISIELTKEGFKFYRKQDNLNEVIDRILDLRSKGWRNLSVNVSINSHLNDYFDEFIQNYELLKRNDIGFHFYSIKGETGFTLNDFYQFLMKLKERKPELYNEIILKDGEISDTEFTCSFNDRITVNAKMEIVNCAWDNKFKCSLDESEDTIMNLYLESLAGNHKSIYNGCSNCEVEIGKCSISCKAFFNDIEKSDNFDLLEKVCNMEKIKEYLRREK